MSAPGPSSQPSLALSSLQGQPSICLTTACVLQVYAGALPILYAQSCGYHQLSAAGLDSPHGLVPVADALAGLEITNQGLNSAATIARYAVSDDHHKRRVRIADEFQVWAAGYPGSVRPTLASCQPAEVLCFLDDWRQRHVGKRQRAASDDDTALPVAPATLRAACGHLSAVFTSLGRCSAWHPDSPSGNPTKHASVTSFLRGYDVYCFKVHAYSSSGAVPLTLPKYVALRGHLHGQAASVTDPSLRVTLLRDLCAFSYLWETGQRGKECCSLLLSDFRYQDLRCTEAWPDLVSGALLKPEPLLVEGSQGTKTRLTRHPGVIQLSKAPNPDGSGHLVADISAYAAAMTSAGTPLSYWLFPRRDPHGASPQPITSSALRQRLILHLSQLQLWEGETLHSFRRGGTQLQQDLGSDPATLARQRLWSSTSSVELYLHPQRHLARLR